MSDIDTRLARLSPAKQALLKQRLTQRRNVSQRQHRIPRRSIPENVPLSFGQERLWFLELLHPTSAVYNSPANIRLTGPCDVVLLGRCLNEIVLRHEVLRTGIRNADGEPRTVVAEAQPLPLPVVDLSALPDPQRLGETGRMALREAQQPFDLSVAPLMRARLLRLAEQAHLLLLTVHHIAFDGWSRHILLHELSCLYQAFSLGQPSPLPELPIQYADFAEWQREQFRSQALDEQLAYWRRQLADLPQLLSLPTDRHRPSVQTYSGASLSVAFPGGLSRGLKELSRQDGATLYMTLLAAFKTLLLRYTGQDDMVVGTPIAGRNRTETEDLIGFFVNTLVMRTDLSGDPTFRGLLARVRRTALDAYRYQDFPFEKLVAELQPTRDLSRNPLFQILFQLRNLPHTPAHELDLKMELSPIDARAAAFDLLVDVADRDEQLRLQVNFNTHLFEESTIQRMVAHYQKLLEGIVSDPDRPVSELLRLSAADSGGHSPLASEVEPRCHSQLDKDISEGDRVESSTVAGIASVTSRPANDDPAKVQTVSDQGQRIARLSPAQRMALEKRLLARAGVAHADGQIPRRDDQGPCRLSFAQERLWILDQLEPDSCLYNIPFAIRLGGALHLAALRRALDNIVARHESLRTTITFEGDTPRQSVNQPQPVDLRQLDLQDLSAARRELEAQHLLVQEARRPFHLSRDPMLRGLLLKMGQQEHILLLVMHHIACDGWSLEVLFRELHELYMTYATGRPARLPELPIQYADFALWQRRWLQGEVLEKQLSYWRQQLEGAPAVLELPTDRPRPHVHSSRGGRHSFALPRELSQDVSALSRQENATLFMILLAAYATLLHRYSGQSDVVVGSPIANRNRTQIERLIGFFVNTLALRINLADNPTFRQLLIRTRDTALDAFAHQDLPFEKLVEQLQPERRLGRSPLFQVMFALQNAPYSSRQLDGLDVTRFDVDAGTAKFDLTLFVGETDEGLRGTLGYRTDLFEESTIQRMAGHYQTLLAGIVADPEQPVSELPLLTEAERQQLLEEDNATNTHYPREVTIAQLFAQQAARTPEAVAVEFDDQQLTYAELNARANQLAHHLRALGVGPEVMVGLCLERSLEMVVGILGIIKAGGAYVPLDPTYPRERLAFMLQDTQASVVLTQQHLVERLPHQGIVIRLDTDWPEIARQDTSNPESAAGPQTLAYVIYTSGSTGQPKGTCIEHRSVVRLVQHTNYVELTPRDVLLQFASISFDASTFEIWGALLNGARLVVFPAHTPSLLELGRFIHERGITTLWLTAVLFHQMVDNELPSLAGVRQLLAGGDVLSVSHVQRVLATLGDSRLINGYGPTENTTFTCCHVMTSPSRIEETVPIGKPISNTRVYVLDEQRRPVPVGVWGELYIGGDGLARGYLNQPRLTAQKFVPDPFSTDASSRLYRSGDLVRWHRDGTLEFRGRADQQVKIRGYRVELGEIEAVLARHESVAQCVVRLCEDRADAKRLVAYWVSRDGAEASSTGLRAHLAATLPDYMLPAVFVPLALLPLTANGKVDRQALPAPDSTRDAAEAEYVAPRDAVEEQLAALWAELLHVDLVGIHDNFFDLGGHSLLATQAVALSRATFGVELKLGNLFEYPTVAGIARLIQEPPQGPNAHLSSPANVVTTDQRSLRDHFRWRRRVEIDPQTVCEVLRVGQGNLPVVSIGVARLIPSVMATLPQRTPIFDLGLDGVHMWPPLYLSFRETLAIYVRGLEACCPERRAVLVGFCYGGLLAHQLACILQARGWTANAVMLIEPSNPRQLRRARWQKLSRWHRIPARIVRAANQIRKSHLVRHEAATTTGDSPEERFTMMHGHYRKNVARSRLRPYAGKVALVASESYHAHCAAHWAALAVQGLEQSIFSGTDDHWAFAKEPYRRQWLAYFQRWYETADNVNA